MNKIKTIFKGKFLFIFGPFFLLWLLRYIVPNYTISSKTPPASLIRIMPAAISHKFTFLCKDASNLPQDTYARSKAALPVFLTIRLSGKFFL
jgi:hypothetical protein